MLAGLAGTTVPSAAATAKTAAVLAAADPSEGGQDPAGKQSDPETYHDFPGSVPDPGVTHLQRYPGRIWTDKSVFHDADELSGEPGFDNFSMASDELLVGLSALGTTRQVHSTRTAAIDLVLVIDNSYSMTQCVGTSNYCNTSTTYTQSRAYAMVQGVNAAISYITAADPNARIAIQSFGTDTQTIYPLETPRLVSGTNQYLAFTAPTGSSTTMTLRTASNASLTVGGPSTQRTNIQRGIVGGMQLLAAQNTTDVAGPFQRIPSMILFSDGEPTYSASSSSWWQPADSGNQGPGSPGATQYYGNGFLAALSAAFWKKRVTTVYNDEAYNSANGFDPVATNIYTVGLGISGLVGGGQQLANATLNPKGEVPGVEDPDSANTMANSFRTAMSSYLRSERTTVSVNSTTGTGPSTFTVTHPIGNITGGVQANTYDPNQFNDIRYNTTFDSPNTAAELIAVFERIANEVVVDKPVLPVETTGLDANADGYVTFTDQLGPFMRVTGMDRIVFCSLLATEESNGSCEPRIFTQFQSSTVDNVTTYEFQGEYKANDIFPETALSNIRITVQRNPSAAIGDFVRVQIPVALLPMLNTHATEDGHGNLTDLTWYDSHPVHIFYRVAPKEHVAEALTDPTVLSADDTQKLADYVKNNTVDHQVRFYSDAFDETSSTGETVRTAQTEASFRPSSQNDFYLYAQDTILYQDRELTRPVTQTEWNGFQPDQELFRTFVSYSKTSDGAIHKENTAIPTTKEALDAAARGALAVHPNEEGQMIAPAGLYDLSASTYNLDVEKCTDLTWVDNSPSCDDPDGNLTKTDPWTRQTTVDPGTAQSVTARLGNNGWLSYDVPGSLIISKSVVHDGNLDPDPDQTFTFTVRDTSGAALTGVDYIVRTAAGAEVRRDTIGSAGTIELTGGQSALLIGLPNGATYSVDEQDPPPGYTLTSPATGPFTGTITTPQDTVPSADFVNTYAVQPTTVDTVEVTKHVAPEWLVGQSYTFRLCPRGDAPAPPDPDETSGCGTTTIDEQDGRADFGSIRFTTPGVYDYGLIEDPTTAPGMAGSLAAYRWRVTVVDNQAGGLTATSTLVRERNDAGAAESPAVAVEPPALFTNTRTEDTLDRPLQIVKRVHDTSLGAGDQQRAPLMEHEFRFSAVQEADPALTFVGGATVATVTSGAGSLTVPSPALHYTDAHVGHTYYYKAEELEPDSPIPGFTFSDQVSFFRIVVGTNTAGGGQLIDPVVTVCQTTQAEVSSSEPWGGCDPENGGTYAVIAGGPVFVNEYDPDPAEATLTAVKTLQGRPWTSQDSFTFTVTPDDTTAAAIRAGDIVASTGSGDAPYTVTVDAPATGGDPNVRFGPLEFHRQGTYRFTLSEDTSDLPAGVVGDGSHPVLVVTVANQFVDGALTGRLVASVSIEGSNSDEPPQFVNTYTGTTTFTNVQLYKVLTGRDASAGEFTFRVTAQDTPSREVLHWTNDSRDLVTWTGAPDGQRALVQELDGVVFNQDQIDHTFTYTIREIDPDLGGVTPDMTVYTVEITPRYDADTESMYVETRVSAPGHDTATYDSREAGSTPEATFANTYRAASADATIHFDKAIIGRDFRSGDSFRFQLTPVTDGAPMPGDDTTTVTSGSPGASANVRTGAFGPITYTEPGEYEYEIHELAPEPGDSLDRLDYDTARVLTVTVTVTDDLQGQLHATVAGPRERFENVYHTPFHYDILKSLTGRDMADGEFRVHVTPQSEAAAEAAGIDYPDGATFAMPGAADGQFSLVTRDGRALLTGGALGQQFCYVYSEVVPDDPLPGVTYDTSRYQLCTTPSQLEDGSFQAETVITNLDTEETRTVVTQENDPDARFPQIAFENAYRSWTLEKHSDPASGSTVQPGSKVTYTLTATNTATSVLSGAVAHDDLSDVLSHAALGALPDGVTRDGAMLTWAIPDVPAGGTVSVSYTVTVDGDAVGVTLRNAVTGAGDVPPPAPCPDSDPDCRQTELYVPQWTLTKTSDPVSGSTVLPGSTVHYTLTATNTSDDAELTGAIAVDDLSGVLAHAALGKLPHGLTLTGTTLHWAIPDLSPGEHVSVTYAATLNDDATGVHLRNVVTGAGDVPAPDPCPGDDPQCRTTEHFTPAWTLSKTSDPASGTAVAPGDKVTYTLTARNTGPVPIGGLSATDDLRHVVDVATLATLPAGLTLSSNGKSLTWAIPDLAVGETTSVSYTVTVAPDTWGETLQNHVKGKGPVDPDQCDAACGTEHPIPYWTLTKTSDPASGSTVQPGDEITYTLRVRNVGPAPVTEAVVTDDLSGVLGSAQLEGALAGGLSRAGSTLTWHVPRLARGDTASVSYTVRVDAGAYRAWLTNVAMPGAGGACSAACSTEHRTGSPAPYLAATGADVVGAGLLALALLLGGVALVVSRRRRAI